MKKTHLFSLLASILIFSCAQQQSNKTDKKKSTPKTHVKVVSISKDNIANALELFGSTIYLKKNLVTAPIPSFITKVKVHLGDKVKKGDLLYVLKSKESKALGNTISKIDNSIANFGIIEVKASASGIVGSLDKQQSGDYVLEGALLCSIVESNNLAFQINIPYEYAALAKINNKFNIVLPNHKTLTAMFTKELNKVDPITQTQVFLAKAEKNIMLPEGLFVKATLSENKKEATQTLPKSCVLSDEMMENYWIMKIANDSTAVKVPVVIGNQNKESIEIISPVFSPLDKIISVGNYGLPNKASVIISSKN